MKKIRIPKTDSIKELARFFETHELGDCDTELAEVHEVTGPIFIPRNSILVRLEPAQATVVKRLAKARGVSEEELVREWIEHQVAGVNGRGRRPMVKGRKS